MEKKLDAAAEVAVGTVAPSKRGRGKRAARVMELAPGVEVLEDEYGAAVFFDENKADFVCDFFGLLCFGQNEWAGKPFALSDWERRAIREFYGVQTRDDDGHAVRYRQYLYIEIPKKNGKSEFAAGLGLYHLLADGETLPLIYIYASDRQNAGIIYNAAKYMVEHCDWMSQPEHNPMVWAVDSLKEIRTRDGGILKVMSSEADSKHGYSPSCIIYDELHAQKKRKLWDITTFASGSARRQQTVIAMTTAGDDPDRNTIGWEIHEKCRRILNLRRGRPERAEDEDDALWCAILYGMSLDSCDDPDVIAKMDIYDEELWKRLNPAIGISVKLRDLRSEAKAARKSDAAERLFRWLRLNQWIAVHTVGWIPLTIYDKTEWHGTLAQLLGKKCYGGLDLSSTTDLSAFALLFPPQEGLDTWVLLPQAWVPLEAIEARENRDHAPYRDWIRAKFLHGCAGDMIDFPDIKAAILDANELYDLQQVGADPYLSRTITSELMAAGISVVEISQGMMSMSPATKEQETLIRSHRLLHVHNTCARWCFGNVRCYVDINENKKPTKKKSTGRIDTAVAGIIAQVTAMLAPPPGLGEAILSDQYEL